VDWLGLEGNQPCLITNANRAWSNDPRVERQLSPEHGANPPEDIQILLTSIWID
jgi:hypothetical protein